MSNLSLIEKRKLEKLLEMSGGYVLDFSNRTFAEFVLDSTQRNIFDAKYEYASGSKANRMRAFWAKEPNQIVGKLLNDLLDYFKERSPSASELSDECRRIAERLLQDASVQEINAIAPNSEAIDSEAQAMTVRMPSAFVSYSWDNEEHKEWVRALCSRLRGDGVDVTLDQWHLIPGDQLPRFMERAVRQSDYVLIVCTPKYKIRSDNRTGGVGYEGDIITAEALNTRNERKFIPILRTGIWKEAAPSWLLGKYYIDLSHPHSSEIQYQDLLTTLLGTRQHAPPLGTATKNRDSAALAQSPAIKSEPPSFDPIRILGVIADEVGTPRNDGTQGSALYKVPFRLSATPPRIWSEIFVDAWNHPSSYTTMHRPGIASVYADKVLLNGTTLEEVERYHRQTLQLALAEANRKYSELRAASLERENRERQRIEDHKKQVEDAAKRIKFD